MDLHGTGDFIIEQTADFPDPPPLGDTEQQEDRDEESATDTPVTHGRRRLRKGKEPIFPPETDINSLLTSVCYLEQVCREGGGDMVSKLINDKTGTCTACNRCNCG